MGLLVLTAPSVCCLLERFLLGLGVWVEQESGTASLIEQFWNLKGHRGIERTSF